MIEFIFNLTFLLLFNVTNVLCWTSTASTFGAKCKDNSECRVSETDLMCSPAEPKLCRCRRKDEWNTLTKRCHVVGEEAYPTNFDPVKDLIIPGIIILTIGAMVYLGIKLFCNCGKLWRRRRRRLDLPRELEENHQQLQQLHQQQQPTWVASYRVFSSLNSMDPRSPPSLSPTGRHGFPMHSTPCVGLFVPSNHLATSSPPPYEEALKHKVIMSSYPGVVPSHGGPPSSPQVQEPHSN